MKNIEQLTQETIKAIASSYGSKYSSNDYEEFREIAKRATSEKQLISLVSSFFDLDYSDAKDMVS